VVVEKIAKGEAAENIGKAAVTRELYLRKESERMASEGAKQILAAVSDGKTLEDALNAHLDAVLPEKVKAAFERGRAQEKDGGEKEDGDKEGEEGEDAEDEETDEDAGDSDPADDNAWNDPARPQVRTSDPFSSVAPPFSQVQNPTDAAKMLFELEKVGSVPSDVIKLYDGYAVAQLKERKPVDKKKWEEERFDFMASMRRDKQRDALIAYVQRLRDQYAKEITYKIKIKEDDETPAEKKDG